MFKPGNKIVCIVSGYNISVDKVYDVLVNPWPPEENDEKVVTVQNDVGVIDQYHILAFESIQKRRTERIEKILTTTQ
jgi:hypothetical protein